MTRPCFRSSVLFLALLMVVTAGHAATFIVPSDRVLVTASKAIVVGVAGQSHARWSPGGWIETVTTLRVEEAIKGTVTEGTTIQVTELGGMVGSVGYFVAGSPRYAEGERVLLFLETNDRGEWVAKNMAVGKFEPAEDLKGRRLLVRDAEEIVGWESDGVVHREPVRLEDAFLRFVRTTARGGIAGEDYIVRDPLPLRRVAVAESTASAFAPSSYLLQGPGGIGIRWPAFPVVFLSHGSQPGAPGGGLTAVQQGLAAWTNDPGSNIVYSYGGLTPIARTGFAGGASDGVNTIQFNDPAGEIPGSFSPQNGATLAIGGAWFGSATHTANGEQYFSIVEADLVVQDGISGPGLTGAGFIHVITHELGHTLGLRHSDKNASDGSCGPDLDCSSVAIMKSSVNFDSDPIGSTLQAWDITALDAVYGSGSACASPRITSAPQTVNVDTAAVTFTVTATGEAPLVYQWYSGTSRNTNLPIGGATSPSFTVKPAVTSAYWVRVAGACDPPADSGTVYAIVNSCPPVVIGSQSDGVTILEGRPASMSVAASGGTLSYQWYVGTTGVTTSPVPGATFANLTVTPSKTTSYWVRVVNTCGSLADSVTITITVTPCNAPRIVVQPSDQTIVTGNGTSLFAAITGTQPLAFQWYEGTFPDTSKVVNGGTSATLTLPSVFAQVSYWLHVSNDCGTTDSSTARLTLVSTCTPPAIALQPQDQSVAPGANAIVSIGVTGPSINYQWYQGPRFDFTHPVGGNSPSLFAPSLTTTTQFWVRISSPCGTVDSAVATVSLSVPSRRRAVGR